jgi:hypothetical protein
MRRSRDRLLVLGLVTSLSMAGCAGSSKGSDGPAPMVGVIGSSLQASNAQFTLVQVIPDPDKSVVTTVLTALNTSNRAVDLSNLLVISLLSDAAGHTYTPDAHSDVVVPQCAGAGFVTPIAPGQTVNGCEYFSVRPGAAPAQLELLVKPTLRWRIANEPAPGTRGLGNGTGAGTGTGTGSGTGTGTGSGTGTGTGSGTGTGTGTGTGPATTHPPHAPHPKKVKKPKVKKIKTPKVKVRKPKR